MKASMDETGCIHLQAETQLEAYALSRWHRENWRLLAPKPLDGDAGYWRADCLLIDAGIVAKAA